MKEANERENLHDETKIGSFLPLVEITHDKSHEQAFHPSMDLTFCFIAVHFEVPLYRNFKYVRGLIHSMIDHILGLSC